MNSVYSNSLGFLRVPSCLQLVTLRYLLMGARFCPLTWSCTQPPDFILYAKRSGFQRINWMKNCWPHIVSWLVQVEVACCYSLLGSGSGSAWFMQVLWVSKIHLKEFSKSIGEFFFPLSNLQLDLPFHIIFERNPGVVGSPSGYVTWKKLDMSYPKSSRWKHVFRSRVEGRRRPKHLPLEGMGGKQCSNGAQGM